MYHDYIPRHDAARVSNKLQTGDMVIFVITKPGIISGHVGLIRLEHGVYVQHASETRKKSSELLLAYLRHAPARFVGFKIARINEQIVCRDSNGSVSGTDTETQVCAFSFTWTLWGFRCQSEIESIASGRHETQVCAFSFTWTGGSRSKLESTMVSSGTTRNPVCAFSFTWTLWGFDVVPKLNPWHGHSDRLSVHLDVGFRCR